MSVLYKVASSEGASWTFTNLFAAAEFGVIGVCAYSGADTGTPLDVAVVQGSDLSTTTPTAGPITSSANGAIIIAVFGADADAGQSGTPDASPAANERVDENGGSSVGYVYMQDYLQITAEAVSLDGNFSATDHWAWMIVALRPAAAGGNAPTGALQGSLVGSLGGPIE